MLLIIGSILFHPIVLLKLHITNENNTRAIIFYISTLVDTS